MSNVNMDSSFIQWLIDGILAIGLFIFKQHADAVKENHKELKEEVINLTQEVTGVKVSYVPKSDLKELKEDINARFDRLEALLKK